MVFNGISIKQIGMSGNMDIKSYKWGWPEWPSGYLLHGYRTWPMNLWSSVLTYPKNMILRKKKWHRCGKTIVSLGKKCRVFNIYVSLHDGNTFNQSCQVWVKKQCMFETTNQKMIYHPNIQTLPWPSGGRLRFSDHRLFSGLSELGDNHIYTWCIPWSIEHLEV